MRYTVRWNTNAESDLTAVWTASHDRNAVTRAATEIDHRLAAAAATEGESRFGTRRITFYPPLAIHFRVVGNEVEVLQVWEFVTR